MTKLKKYFEIIVLTIYTFFTLKIIYPVLMYKISNVDVENQGFVKFLNTNLLIFTIGIFLNIALIIYSNILPKKIEIIILVIYTFINFKLMSILLFKCNFVFLNHSGLFAGLFLNAGIILYWSRKNAKK